MFLILHVPDKVYAYTLQVRYMLYNLMKASLEDVISLEAFGDNAVQSSDGAIDSQEIKSSLSPNNPIADRSDDFWKTLFNWLEALKKERSLIKVCKYKLVLISTKHHKAGKLIENLHKANDIKTAIAALETAKNELWGVDLSKKANIPENYAKYLVEIFDKKNKDDVVNIINNFELLNHSNEFDDNLMTEFNNQPIPTEYIQEIYYLVFGWINDNVNYQIKNNVPAFISRREYNEFLSNVIRKYDRDTILHSKSTELSGDGKKAEINKEQIYIKQLEIVKSPFEILLDAANSFMRVSKDIAVWAKKGIIIQTSFDEFEDNLKRAFSDAKVKNTIINRKLSDEEQGLLIYIDCKEKLVRLDSKDTPSYFTTGYYNKLSNEKIVGWHPKYNELLAEVDKNEK